MVLTSLLPRILKLTIQHIKLLIDGAASRPLVQVPKASECPSVCAAMHCISSTHTEIGIASICMLPIYLVYVCQTKELEHT